MDIKQILEAMATKAAVELAEGVANRPLDQATGDPKATPAPVADPAGGVAGSGGIANRPADNTSEKDPAPAPVQIEVVQPVNTTSEPPVKGPKTVGKGADQLEPTPKGLSEAFTAHLNEAVAEVKVDITESAKPILETLQLDEEFAGKVQGLLEGAANSIAVGHLKTINEKAGALIEHLLNTQFKLMEEKADRYMETVISEWTEENRIAIEQGIRTQIAEGFMDKLKALLESHYVELPAGKKDLYEAAIAKGDEILESYNIEKEKSISLAEEVSALKRKLSIEHATRGMTATKAEKVRELAESVAFDDKFSDNVKTLVEEVNKPAAPAVTPGKHAVTDPAGVLVESEQTPKAMSNPLIDAASRFLSTK